MSGSVRRQREERDTEDWLFTDTETQMESSDELDRPDGPPDLRAERVPSSMSYFLVHRTASLDSDREPGEPSEAESLVAIGRGKAEPAQTDGDAERTYTFEFGDLETESGFSLRVVPESLADLPIYDILTVPTLESHPLPKTALRSIPGGARAKLRRDGYLKCHGIYDRDRAEFQTVRYGWHKQPEQVADILGEVLEEFGGDHPLRALYYFLNHYASDQYADPEAIAELRDIKSSTVIDEIRAAERELDPLPLRE